MLKTSSTYLFQSFTGIGSSGPRAMFSKYSIYMLATTGEHGGTHSSTLQLFEELILEGEHTVLQDQFQEFHNLIFFQANGVCVLKIASILVFSFWVLYMFSEQPVDDV